MKKKNNLGVKIGAGIALLAIIASIVGTAAVFIFGSSNSLDESVTQISEEELQEYLDSLPEPEVSTEELGEDISNENILDQETQEGEETISDAS